MQQETNPFDARTILQIRGVLNGDPRTPDKNASLEMHFLALATLIAELRDQAAQVDQAKENETVARAERDVAIQSRAAAEKDAHANRQYAERVQQEMGDMKRLLDEQIEQLSGADALTYNRLKTQLQGIESMLNGSKLDEKVYGGQNRYGWTPMLDAIADLYEENRRLRERLEPTTKSDETACGCSGCTDTWERGAWRCGKWDHVSKTDPMACACCDGHGKINRGTINVMDCPVCAGSGHRDDVRKDWRAISANLDRSKPGNPFNVVAPTDENLGAMDQIRHVSAELAEVIKRYGTVPEYTAQALGRLQEAAMWANKSITHGGK